MNNFVLTEEQVKRVAGVLRRIEHTPFNDGDRADLTEGHTNDIVIVKSDGTQKQGRTSGVVLTYDGPTGTTTELGACWIVSPNGNALPALDDVTGIYIARNSGSFDPHNIDPEETSDERPLFMTADAGGTMVAVLCGEIWDTTYNIYEGTLQEPFFIDWEGGSEVFLSSSMRDPLVPGNTYLAYVSGLESMNDDEETLVTRPWCFTHQLAPLDTAVVTISAQTSEPNYWTASISRPAGTWLWWGDEFNNCFVYNPNQQPLDEDTGFGTYLAKRWGYKTIELSEGVFSTRPLYLVAQPFNATPIMLQEDGGNIQPIHTLDVKTENGLDVGPILEAGVGTITIEQAGVGQTGVVTGGVGGYVSQGIAGGKIFYGDLFVQYSPYASYPSGGGGLSGDWPQATAIRNCWIRFLEDQDPIVYTDFYRHAQGCTIENYGLSIKTTANFHEDGHSFTWNVADRDGSNTLDSMIIAFKFAAYTGVGVWSEGASGNGMCTAAQGGIVTAIDEDPELDGGTW